VSRRQLSLRAAFLGTSALAAGLIFYHNAVEGWLMYGLYGVIVKHPMANDAVGYVTGPIVKHTFNAPAKAGKSAPAPLDAATIEAARKVMVANFRPEAGQVLVAISGGGDVTVHCFVVSGVSPAGHVQLTQAIAQTDEAPENYDGPGGRVMKALDGVERNAPRKMDGVVVADWKDYANRSKRNSIVLLALDTTPTKASGALAQLKALVGRPYDRTMLAADPATAASMQAFYCTELTAWFINTLRPGTVKLSKVAVGYPVFQVVDHMRATTLHGGPLRVIFNGRNRLDIAALDPHPREF
jgi:hypothetical protein